MKIVYLEDKEGNRINPVTHIDGVFSGYDANGDIRPALVNMATKEFLEEHLQEALAKFLNKKNN